MGQTTNSSKRERKSKRILEIALVSTFPAVLVGTVAGPLRTKRTQPALNERGVVALDVMM